MGCTYMTSSLYLRWSRGVRGEYQGLHLRLPLQSGDSTHHRVSAQSLEFRIEAKCLLDTVETPMSLIHCHTLCLIGLQ